MTRLGYKKDIADVRDMRFGAKFSTVPTSYESMIDLYDISLEQIANSCVGYSLTNALYSAWRLAGNKSPKIASPLFIWYNSRKTHGDEKHDSGTYIRSAIKQMSKVGFCPNETWEGTDGGDILNYKTPPPLMAYVKAYDQKLTDLQYTRIDNVVNIKDSLSEGHPVVFGMDVYQSFMDQQGSQVYNPSLTNDILVGGHAMCALGYNKDYLIGPNSWGKSWGDNGLFKISWSYLNEFASDMWSLNVPDYFSVVKENS